MRYLMLVSINGLALIAAASGGGSGSGIVGNSTPPQLMSASPADGAGPAGINVNPEVVVSEALNAGSVNDTTVSLADSFRKQIRGTVSCVRPWKPFRCAPGEIRTPDRVVRS